MFKHIGLLSVTAAATFALAACQPKPAEAPANNAAPTVEPTAIAAGGSPTGGVCGGIGGQKCSSDKDFCKTPTGQCKVADPQGQCTSRPQVCTKEYVPVCGCDGKTYGNACEADSAGVSVDAVGVCPKPKG